MMTLVYIVVAVLILMFMITVHEVGHYLAGKILKFKITEFSIGMGKAIFKRTNKKTGEVFSIRMLPIGGYCAFYGDDADSLAKSDNKAESIKDNDSLLPDTEPAPAVSFLKQPPWKRLIVLAAGGIANFICAILFSVVLLMIFGYHNNVQVVRLADNMPTENAWMQEARFIDRTEVIEGETVTYYDLTITAINGEKFTFIKSFSSVLAKYDADTPITVTVIDKNGVVTQETVIKTTVTGFESPAIGINEYGVKFVKLGFFAAVGKSFVFCAELAWLVLSFLGKLIVGKMSFSDVGGPIATVSVMAQSVKQSLLNIFVLVPLISVNLAVFNLLPVPALDGARMVFVGLEWIRKKPINQQIENRIHVIGIIVLFGLVILADVNYMIIQRFLQFMCLRL